MTVSRETPDIIVDEDGTTWYTIKGPDGTLYKVHESVFELPDESEPIRVSSSDRITSAPTGRAYFGFAGITDPKDLRYLGKVT